MLNQQNTKWDGPCKTKIFKFKNVQSPKQIFRTKLSKSKNKL